MALLALDMRFFCTQSTASQAERLEAVTALLTAFVILEEGEEDADEDDDIPESLRRAFPTRDTDAQGF